MTDITLFDLPAAIIPGEPATDWRPEQLRQMHNDHGVLPGQTCGGCIHCSMRPGNTRGHYKCTLYGRYTNGPGTDWRKKWPACGGWLSRSDHPLPDGWILERDKDGSWRARDKNTGTAFYIRREDAAAAAWE